MRLSKKRLAAVAVGLVVVLAWVAIALGAWELALAALVALQGAGLALLLENRTSARTMKTISRSLAQADRRIDNLGARVVAAQESTRLEIADLNERVATDRRETAP